MFGSPRPACGERSDGEAIRVRGTLREHEPVESPLTIADASHRRSSIKNGGRRPPTPSPRKRGEGEVAPPLHHALNLARSADRSYRWIRSAFCCDRPTLQV